MPRHLMGVALGLVLVTSSVQAQFNQFITLDVGGFLPNSASAGYLAAVGGSSQYHLGFDVDQFGSPIGGSPVEGNVFSTVVTFSSINSATFGGLTSTAVNWSPLVGHEEIGPTDSWYGILNIDFIGNGQGALAVGFGTVVLSDGDLYRLYDLSDVLIASGGFSGFATWGFMGWVATGSERIGRIELEGDFFAIQDIHFNTELVVESTVPEPATMTLLATGLAGLAAARRRNRKA